MRSKNNSIKKLLITAIALGGAQAVLLHYESPLKSEELSPKEIKSEGAAISLHQAGEAGDEPQPDAEAPPPVYNPAGKRDPFMPFDLAPKKENEENLSPLERLNLGQLKLTAVLKGFDDATAVVEDQSGKGYTIKKGTKIGTDNGEVVEIKDDAILIVERNIDFAGQEKTRTVEMKMNHKTGLKGVRINPSAAHSGN